MQRRKLKVIQATNNLAGAPLWDTELRAKLKRMDEFNKVFNSQEYEASSTPPTETVTFICPVYNTYPEILSSLINQTHKDWKLLLLHDGVNSTGIRELVNFLNDPRITYIESPEHNGKWGHPLRQWALTEIKNGKLAQRTDYIVITNGDNHLVPTFCEYMLQGFKRNPDAIATYCSQMIHGALSPQIVTTIPQGAQKMNSLEWRNWRWGLIQCKLELGHIDCSGVMVRKDIACEIGWRSMEHSSDWIYFSDIMKRYGKDRWEKVDGCLLIHN